MTDQGLVEGAPRSSVPTPSRLPGRNHRLAPRELSATNRSGLDACLTNWAAVIVERTGIRIDRSCPIGPATQIYGSDILRLNPELVSGGRHLGAPMILGRKRLHQRIGCHPHGSNRRANGCDCLRRGDERDVPLNSVVAGSPVRAVRQLDNEDRCDERSCNQRGGHECRSAITPWVKAQSHHHRLL